VFYDSSRPMGFGHWAAFLRGVIVNKKAPQSPLAFNFSLWTLFFSMTVLACLLAYIFRPLREVIYIDQDRYGGKSDVVEFVESGRRVKVDIEGKAGDKFKMQSWLK